jgi:hypothetical protein
VQRQTALNTLRDYCGIKVTPLKYICHLGVILLRRSGISAKERAVCKQEPSCAFTIALVLEKSGILTAFEW